METNIRRALRVVRWIYHDNLSIDALWDNPNTYSVIRSLIDNPDDRPLTVRQLIMRIYLYFTNNQDIHLMEGIHYSDAISDKLLDVLRINANVTRNHILAHLLSGADVNACSSSAMPALILAVLTGHLEVCRLLVDAGVNVNCLDGDGSTPLMVSAQYGYVDIARLLVSASAILHCVNSLGYNVIHYAANVGSVELIDLFCESGLNPDFPSGEGETALLISICRDQLPSVKTLLKHGARVEVTNNKGVFPLVAAAHYNRAEIAACLIEWGNQGEVDRPYHANRTALMAAVIAGNLAVVCVLIDHHANVNAQDAQGLTALHYAVKYKKIFIMEWLLLSGASALIQDENGNTPFALALLINDPMMRSKLRAWLIVQELTESVYVLKMHLENLVFHFVFKMTCAERSSQFFTSHPATGYANELLAYLRNMRYLPNQHELFMGDAMGAFFRTREKANHYLNTVDGTDKRMNELLKLTRVLYGYIYNRAQVLRTTPRSHAETVLGIR